MKRYSVNSSNLTIKRVLKILPPIFVLQASRFLSSMGDFGIETVGCTVIFKTYELHNIDLSYFFPINSDLLLSSPLILLSKARAHGKNEMDTADDKFLHVSTLQNALDVIRRVSALVAPKSNTAMQMLHSSTNRYSLARSTTSRWHLQTGVDELDRVLGGGLPSKLISEIAGPPGVGKTQFCLTCLLSALSATRIPSQEQESSIIYIDTVRIVRWKQSLPFVLMCSISLCRN